MKNYDRYTKAWMEKYVLAKAYYEYYGNLEIPQKFKTKNGYDYDENGVMLGNWIANQRRIYKSKGYIEEEKKRLLDELGMRWDNIDIMNVWMDNYNLAKTYYEHYGNLEIPQKFKTKNGYDYDDEGINIGMWLNTQRQAYKGNRTFKITKEQITLLDKLEMRWENKDTMDVWMKNYNLAKIYYEHYGNLEISSTFKTKNGYEYDEDGVFLGTWIANQRNAYKGCGTCKMTAKRRELLDEIGMRWDNIDTMNAWMKNYNLSKKYYEYYGNLEISQNFKTINGYEYDENGVFLGAWIRNQRQAYKGNSTFKINEEQISLLNQIGMRWENIDTMNAWMEHYNLAKTYYEYHGNLKIPVGFKTINGYEYDDSGVTLGIWINNQRQTYKGRSCSKISDEQFELLEQIDMVWFVSDKTNAKLQSEVIIDKNNKKKQIEILNRFRTLLNQFEGGALPSKEEINREFVKQLTLNPKRR